jgi:hypothetical protein
MAVSESHGRSHLATLAVTKADTKGGSHPGSHLFNIIGVGAQRRHLHGPARQMLPGALGHGVRRQQHL